MPDDQRLTPAALAAVAMVSALLVVAPAGGQRTSSDSASRSDSAEGRAAPAPDSLRVDAGWDVARRQPHDAVLAFSLSRQLQTADGRLAVIVGRADLSALVDVRGTSARLSLRGAPLASNALDVEVWLVDGGGAWRELGRFPLQRLTRGGFDSASVRPRLDVQTDGQLDARPLDAAPPSPRGDAYQDVTLNSGLDGNVRRHGWDVSWQGLVTGASNEPARLRASQLGPRAPMMDLAAYNVRASRGGFALAAGHIALGSNRLLASQFRSRGVSADIAMGRRATLALGTAAGSEIVGWSDPLGLARPSHRVASAALGIEAVPSRPGALRVELTALDGSTQSLPAFSQQAVLDREASTGFGAQIAAADPSQRLRFTAGVARSRFTNPHDPLLAGDSSLVPVRATARSARFGELAVDALRGATIWRHPANLSLIARHDRADPLYRSVAATLQADREQDAIEAAGGLGVLQLQLSASRSRDNLASVPSLLITRTRAYAFNAALPVGPLVHAAGDAWWWPALTAAWQTTTQRGDTTPPDGGFRAAFQIPDQRTANLTLGATWQRASWSATYRFNRSVVDNRQPERERADFTVGVQALTISSTLSPSLSLAIDLTREAQRNGEADTRATNERLGFQADWRPFRHTALAAAASLVRTRDDAATQRARNVEMRLEASQGINAWVRPADGSQARAFVRWARTGAALRLAGVPQPFADQWTLNGGLSVRLF